MPNTTSKAGSIAEMLVGSDASGAIVFCRHRRLTDADVDALVAWQESGSDGAERPLTLVKSPRRALAEFWMGAFSGSSGFGYIPVPTFDPEHRLRCESPDVRVRVGRRSRRLTWELEALCSGSLLLWV